MASPEDWSRAYARQARADLAARAVLCADGTLPVCAQLHFLQMACEKLCKAYLCRSGSDPQDLQTSHAYIAKTLPLIARELFVAEYGRDLSGRSWLMAHIRHFAREIELLAPAVDANRARRDNAEYPWEDASGMLIVPEQYEFPNLNFLSSAAGRSFLKLVAIAITELC
jgi:hypothetical protein